MDKPNAKIQPLQTNSKTNSRFYLTSNSNDSNEAEFKALQGQCSITDAQFLQYSCIRIFFLGIPLILTIVGIFFLKQFKSLRKVVFYHSSQAQVASTIFVYEGKNQVELCSIKSKVIKEKTIRYFYYKKLSYEIIENHYLPMGMLPKGQLPKTLSILNCGLTSAEVLQRREYYGSNIHTVDIPNYFQYIIDTMTTPIYILQYINTIVLIFEGLPTFGIFLVGFAYLTTSINYIFLYKSLLRIKKAAEEQFTVDVLRDGSVISVQKSEIVAGDLYQPGIHVPCDSLLLQGELFANQSNLTGETMPIGKFPLHQNINDKQHWLYEGSTILSKKDSVLALAVNTGYTSTKGRIIRKIINRQVQQPEFVKTFIYRTVQAILVTIILYAATYSAYSNLQIDTTLTIFRFFDFFFYSFPASLPIFFNIGYSLSLARLREKQIYGVEPQKSVAAARVKIACFDKTGTLTEASMKLAAIVHLKSNQTQIDVTNNMEPLIELLFASCHSVQQINGKDLGDQIDLTMFRHTGYSISLSKKPSVILELTKEDKIIQVLRINQYQSRFQSMSVLVKFQDKLYVFAKGSPQLIESQSIFKYNNFKQRVKDFSLKGLRSIAFSYKKITLSECDDWMINQERKAFLIGTTVLGIVAFENKLKDDAVTMMEGLRAAEIKTKMITGDDVFVAVRTAMSLQIVKKEEKVFIFQGKNNPFGCSIFKGVSLIQSQNGIKEKQFQISSLYQIHQKCHFAIDNAFLENQKYNVNIMKTNIFARISPENKSMIIKLHKNLVNKQFNDRNCLNRIIGQQKINIAMVGDGANDLMAIREADLGLGISNSDAVYSSSFTIDHLSDIIHIFRQSKNVQRQIIEVVQYVGLVFIYRLALNAIILFDVSNFTTFQAFYQNFGQTLLLSLLLLFTSPFEELTAKMNDSNFMSIKNQIIFWGNSIFLVAGCIGAYLFYSLSLDFIPNSTPIATFSTGYSRFNSSSTVSLLISVLFNVTLPIILYISKPFKVPIYKSLPFFIVLILNIIVSIALFFLTKFLAYIEVVAVNTKEAAIVLAITIGVSIFSYIFTFILQEVVVFNGHKEQMEKIEALPNQVQKNE